MPKTHKVPTFARASRNSGFGIGYTSPIKARDDRKSRIKVKNLGHNTLVRAFLAQLENLDANSAAPSSPGSSSQRHDTNVTVLEGDEEVPIDGHSDDWVDEDDQKTGQHVDAEYRPYERPIAVPAGRRTQPLGIRWETQMKNLKEPLLQYLSRTMGKRLVHPSKLESNCRVPAGNCVRKEHTVVLLMHDCFEKTVVHSCECSDICSVLVLNGFFPSSPTAPRLAVSISLLDFYRALFERSCDAVYAFTAACKTYYQRRGFLHLSDQGEVVEDAWRRSIASAMKWYENIQDEIQQAVDDALREADEKIQAHRWEKQQQTSQNLQAIHQPRLYEEHEGTQERQECDRVLQQVCPACFGGKPGSFGMRSSKRRGDFHVALDGNFNHRHIRREGQSNEKLYRHPDLYLTAEYVNEVGEHMKKVREGHPRPRIARVPDEAVDECEDGHIAGQGTKVKTNTQVYDDTGTMAMVCRHDYPLFLANIDTPGEQQKYAVALIKKLFTMIPQRNRGGILRRWYEILPESITSRLEFCTSAMHAYAHQWACQLYYNPRFQDGTGNTNGEGTERLWAIMRKLIAIARMSSRSRRLWLINQLMKSHRKGTRQNLGKWVKTQRTAIAKQIPEQQSILQKVGIPITELRSEWEDQREKQLSIRGHQPTRLKQQLDEVLRIQADIDRIDARIEAMAATVQKADDDDDPYRSILHNMKVTRQNTLQKMEQHYESLNVGDAYPELRGMDYKFVKTLLLMRDLKINIRKRAIAQFLEFDRLNQAYGGKEQPLGTNLHQLTRKAIENRQPALMAAIERFNTHRAQLVKLIKPEWGIVLPRELPVNLTELRDHSDLMEDVWLTPATGGAPPPRWLESVDVRRGIRAMLTLERCQEEIVRLNLEADNMCRWYGREIASVEVAIRETPNRHIVFLLEEHRRQILTLPGRWASKQVPIHHYETHYNRAQELLAEMGMSPGQAALRWVDPVVLELGDPDIQPSEDADTVELTEEGCRLLDEVCEDSSTQEPPQYIPAVVWEVPTSIARDTEVARAITIDAGPGTRDHSLRRFRLTHRVVDFPTQAIDILSSQGRQLDDDCINGGAALLQHLFTPLNSPTPGLSPAERCAILSTFSLVYVKNKRGMMKVWDMEKATEYWSKELWLLPMHRPAPVEHWVLCAIYPHHRQLLLFDSFGEKEPWADELPLIMKLIEHLVLGANTHGHPLPLITDQDWTAFAANTSTLQTSSTTCGLWVLAQIVAHVRGFHVTGASEPHLQLLRAYLYRQIINQLPLRELHSNYHAR
ncbi:hypothetical protein CC2G_014365 [Coprinopsis cinerea AmutBmut pab1-1]|nr:hypothetical protein CC2G_014365 [Coprinopsis cinerea AmutBmut pab1-1]